MAVVKVRVFSLGVLKYVRVNDVMDVMDVVVLCVL